TCAISHAQTPDYFPLQTGNSWIYRSLDGNRRDVQSVEVGDTSAFDGNTYFRLTFFGREVWVRKGADANVYVYDPQTQRESLFIPTAGSEGQTFDTALDPCTRKGKIESKKAKHQGPLGDFENVLQISY